MKTGVVGASGYGGELLVRLLARHPRVELAQVTSRSPGKRVAEAIPALRGLCPELKFTLSDPQLLASSDVDLWFLALPHGVAADFARPLIEAGVRVIDLSADFRLNSPALYKEYYKHEHPAPELLAGAPYVLPELERLAGRDGWKQARLIACPGCYPTSILLPLVPLLRSGVVEAQGIVVNAYSGVSGAGKKADEFYSFCERAETMVAYGAPRHRHLSEIEEQLGTHAGTEVVLQFTPHLAPTRQGIATTIVAKARKGLAELYAAWEAAYPAGSTPFVQVLPSGTFPETRHVLGTNRADISAVHDPRTGNFVITSAIDNLWKGASGQAIQIMNLLNGYGETEGLL